jgi:NitT/TauT family transport system ATP-binding protein
MEEGMSDVIEARRVSKTFADRDGGDGGTMAISEASFVVRRGEFVSLLGPSGCGKSTLLHIMGGLEAASSGEVLIDGQSLHGPDRRVATVFQQISSFPWRTAIENVQFGLELRGVARAPRIEIAREMLNLVGLTGFEDKYPAELSGGMNQRVAIARALALDPEILLMDEPFGALDEQTRRLMGTELIRIWKRARKTIVFVTHSIQESIQLSDRILLMSARPSRIRDDISVGLRRPRTVESLTSDEAKLIERQVWHALLEEVGEGVGDD